MKKVIYVVMSTMPALVFAQNWGPLNSFLNFLGTTVKSLIPIVFGLAIVYFFWGLAQYIRASGDPKKAAEGKGIMVWGVVAIGVMLSIYGIVLVLQTILGVTGISTLPVPSVQGLP